MSLSFLNFIEEHEEIENSNINTVIYNEEKPPIKEEPIFVDSSSTNFLNLSITDEKDSIKEKSILKESFNEDFMNENFSLALQEIKPEKLVQNLELDKIYFKSFFPLHSLENKLLCNAAFFFEENDFKYDYSLILKIYNKYCIQIINKMNYFNRIKFKKKSFNNFIFYRICISNLKRDLRIHVTNIKGDVLFMCSARACLDLLYRRVKRVKKRLIVQLVNHFLKQSFAFFSNEKNEENTFFFNTQEVFTQTIPVALHFKNLRGMYSRMIVKKLKNQFEIHSMDSYCSDPHNGCRPKKIRRVKRRKKRF